MPKEDDEAASAQGVAELGSAERALVRVRLERH
jgi:hypothetical protein